MRPSLTALVIAPCGLPSLLTYDLEYKAQPANQDLHITFLYRMDLV
jgi:hypothetical protein